MSGICFKRFIPKKITSYFYLALFLFGVLLLVDSRTKDDAFVDEAEQQIQQLLNNHNDVRIRDRACGGMDGFYFLPTTVPNMPQFNGKLFQKSNLYNSSIWDFK